MFIYTRLELLIFITQTLKKFLFLYFDKYDICDSSQREEQLVRPKVRMTESFLSKKIDYREF